MSIMTFLLPSLLACTTLALTLRLVARPGAAKSVSRSGSYDAIDAYIEGKHE